MSFKFEIIFTSKKSSARVGRIITPHGIIDTPGFVAVGTNGVLKAVDSSMALEEGVQLMFCNTYHLLLQPGTNVVKKAGGLHSFMNRKGPIITDSGGFQVFSLAYGGVHDELKSRGVKKESNSVLRISEEGALFRSYRDGSKILLTPESSIAAQKDFGADIIIALDELPPYHLGKEKLKSSLDRTHRWEERSLNAHLASPQGQALFAVVHGGVDPALRKESCEKLSSLPFDGFAIGGSVGKDRMEMVEVLRFTMPHLPPSYPIHLLGIGDLQSIAMALPFGIDTFDSSYPTKAARHGLILASSPYKIARKIYAEDFTPLEEGCLCRTCRNYSKAYLHHLFKAGELSFYSLASVHNLHFMARLMEQYRNKILSGEI